MSRRSTVVLVLLALIWGASFMFIKVADRQFDPFALVWLRLSLAAFVLVPMALIVVGRSAIPEAKAAWARLTVMGVANSALPFLLITWAETRIDSGLTAILQAAAPLFAVLISFRVGTEQVRGSRLAGTLVGFVGVALLVGADTGGSKLAALAVIAAAASYAAAGYFGAHALGDTKPLVIAAGSIAASAIITAPTGIATLPSSLPGWKEISSVIVLGVVGTGIAYALYFRLLRTVGPSRSILVTYLVPPVAVTYGVLLLGESLEATAIIGLVLILGGVWLAARKRPAPSPTASVAGHRSVVAERGVISESDA